MEGWRMAANSLASGDTMIELKVPDMTCGHCVSTITKAVKELDASAKVDISLAEHCVRVESKASKEDLVHCVAEAGYAPEVL
jgi:copper chaperone